MTQSEAGLRTELINLEVTSVRADAVYHQTSNILYNMVDMMTSFYNIILCFALDLGVPG